MNDKLQAAVTWKADQALFTPQVRQRMIDALSQAEERPPLRRHSRKKMILLAAALLSVLVLAGFAAASLFEKLFTQLTYHDVVVRFKETAEYEALVENLAPGDVAVKVLEERGASVLYKYYQGDAMSLELYGDNVPWGGFMVVPGFQEDVPGNRVLDILPIQRTPEDYRQEGSFAFALENLEDYRLEEVFESRDRLHSLTYRSGAGHTVTVQTSYGRYYSPDSDGNAFRWEETTLGGRPVLLVETTGDTGATNNVYVYLGEDRLVPAIELQGDVPMEDLLELAGHLVLYNENDNRLDAVRKRAFDVFADSPDPLLQQHSGAILAAVRTGMDSTGEQTVWSREGRSVCVDPNPYGSYDIQVIYTPQAWEEARAGYRIPEPPLTPYGWTPGRSLSDVTLTYWRDEFQGVSLHYADGESWDSLLAIPLESYRPQSQLDALLSTLVVNCGQIPTRLEIRGERYYSILELEETGDLWVTTAVLEDGAAWGFQYATSLEPGASQSDRT